MDDPEEHLAHIPRWLAAAYGGVATSAAQFFGQGQGPKLASYVVKMQLENLGILILTVLIGTAIFMLLGSLAGFFSNEQSRIKLFWLGVGAPALFAVALPGTTNLISQASISTPAYAAESMTTASCDPDQLTLGKSLRSFFGLDEPRYRVIVGSFKRPDLAKALAIKLNASNSSIKAVVGDKSPCNDFFPVAVANGDYYPLAKAKQIQSDVLQNDVDGAYLSPER